MDPRAFLGSAGTGKTYELSKAATEFCLNHEPAGPQRVLALTFMHGARTRIADRLTVLKEHGWRVDAETIDSFALRLVRRFRRGVGLNGIIRPTLESSADWHHDGRCWRGSFDAIRSTTAGLLSRPHVQACIAATYPLIVLDEIQDCRDELLSVLQALAACTQVVCAGDPFQLLESNSPPAPAVEWLTDSADVTRLTEVHRTQTGRLLRTAGALRSCTPTEDAIDVLGVRAPGLGAWEIAKRIAWDGWWGDTVLLSPARPTSSSFTAQVLRSLTKSLGKKTSIGPFPFTWEPSHEEAAGDAMRSAMNALGEDTEFSLSRLEEAVAEVEGMALRIVRAARRTIRLRGDPQIDRTELQEIAERFVHAARVHTRGARPGRRAMTIHAAKNREFDYVFVLWPYEIASGEEYHRRLLYNAITRACTDAVVIVQGGEKRVATDPVLQLIA